MPQFSFTAVDEQGREQRGQLEAPDIRSAAATLRQQSLFVVELGGGSGTASNPTPGEGVHLDVGSAFRQLHGLLLPIRAKDRIFFLQQLALMLRSGLTLLQSLEVCREHTSKPALADAIKRVAESIQSGKSFSKALAQEKILLPHLGIKLIESAEASGEMDTVLSQLATHLEQKQELRTTLLTGLTYPAIVLLVSIGVATFLVVKVIPQFSKFFAQRAVSLPWSTQLLLDISDYVITYGLPIFLVLLGTTLALSFAYTTERGRLSLDRIFLYIPVVGKLLTVGAMAQLTRTLSMLLNSGLTLLDSLRIVRTVIGNQAISSTLTRAAKEVLGGRDLASSLMNSTIPSLVPRVVAVGERTGALAHVLEELSEFYRRDLQARIKRMTTLVEPVLILIIGVMVGFVYFAFFQAIFQLATAAA